MEQSTADADSEQGVAEDPGDSRVLHQGKLRLYKEGPKAAESRFFVLREDRLEYYASAADAEDPASRPRGQLPTKHISACSECEKEGCEKCEKAGASFASFELCMKGKSLHLTPADEDSRQAWVAAFQTALGDATPPDSADEASRPKPICEGMLGIITPACDQRRYFVLHEHQLVYYFDSVQYENGGEPRGQIKVEDVERVKVGADDIFTVLMGREVRLRSNFQEDAVRWGRAWERVFKGAGERQAVEWATSGESGEASEGEPMRAESTWKHLLCQGVFRLKERAGGAAAVNHPDERVFELYEDRLRYYNTSALDVAKTRTPDGEVLLRAITRLEMCSKNGGLPVIIVEVSTGARLVLVGPHPGSGSAQDWEASIQKVLPKLNGGKGPCEEDNAEDEEDDDSESEDEEEHDYARGLGTSSTATPCTSAAATPVSGTGTHKRAALMKAKTLEEALTAPDSETTARVALKKAKTMAEGCLAPEPAVVSRASVKQAAAKSPVYLEWMSSLSPAPVHQGMLGFHEKGRMLIRWAVLFADRLDAWDKPLDAPKPAPPPFSLRLREIRAMETIEKDFNSGFLLVCKAPTRRLGFHVPGDRADLGAWQLAFHDVLEIGEGGEVTALAAAAPEPATGRFNSSTNTSSGAAAFGRSASAATSQLRKAMSTLSTRGETAETCDPPSRPPPSSPSKAARGANFVPRVGLLPPKVRSEESGQGRRAGVCVATHVAPDSHAVRTSGGTKMQDRGVVINTNPLGLNAHDSISRAGDSGFRTGPLLKEALMKDRSHAPPEGGHCHSPRLQPVPAHLRPGGAPARPLQTNGRVQDKVNPHIGNSPLLFKDEDAPSWANKINGLYDRQCSPRERGMVGYCPWTKVGFTGHGKDAAAPVTARPPGAEPVAMKPSRREDQTRIFRRSQ